MGILDRFTSIVKANINELLDKAEDPEKMVDQYLREMTESLAEVREATAGVMAEERRCKKGILLGQVLGGVGRLLGQLGHGVGAIEHLVGQDAPDARQAGGRYRGAERAQGHHQGQGRRGQDPVQGERDDFGTYAVKRRGESLSAAAQAFWEYLAEQ